MRVVIFPRLGNNIYLVCYFLWSFPKFVAKSISMNVWYDAYIVYARFVVFIWFVIPNPRYFYFNFFYFNILYKYRKNVLFDSFSSWKKQLYHEIVTLRYKNIVLESLSLSLSLLKSMNM